MEHWFDAANIYVGNATILRVRQIKRVPLSLCDKIQR